jgi:hypothetical protein
MKDFSLNLIQPLFIQIGYTVAQLTVVLRYKSEVRGFYSRWCHNPSGRTLALGMNQPLTENSTPLSYAVCLEMWDPQPPGTLLACPGL